MSQQTQPYIASPATMTVHCDANSLQPNVAELEIAYTRAIQTLAVNLAALRNCRAKRVDIALEQLQ